MAMDIRNSMFGRQTLFIRVQVTSKNPDQILADEYDYACVDLPFVARIRKVSLICLISGHNYSPPELRDQMRRTAFPSRDGLICSTLRCSRPILHGSSDSRPSETRARIQLMM